MKFFEDNKPPADAAALIFALLREFKEDKGYIPSRNLSPSGLGCKVSCAFKLQGVPTEPEMSSFQSRSFAENGEDRHARIQGFLSKTPYWVNVADYIKARPRLRLRVVTAEDQVTERRNYFETRVAALATEYKQHEQDGTLDQWADADEYESAKRYLDTPIEQQIKEVEAQNKYETLLVHEKYPIRFKCDGILLIEGVYYILEIKTERQSVNNERTTHDPKHELQGISYATLLGTSRVLWLYEGRDHLEQKLFVQLVTEAQKQEWREYIQDILENVNTVHKLERTQKSCGYCNYKKHCRALFKQFKKEGLI